MQTADILAILILLSCIGAILLYMRKRKNRCCGGCSGCGYAQSCKQKDKKEQEAER